MDKLVVVIATVLGTAVPLVLPIAPVPLVLAAGAAALLAMTWAAWRAGAWQGVHVSFLFALVFAWGASGIWPDSWPLQALVPFVTYLVLVAFFPRLRDTASWLRRGSLGEGVVLLSVAAVAIPVLALIGWAAFAAPDLARWSQVIPDWSPPALVVAGLLFSVANAALEESIYRGVLLEGLDAALGPGALAVVLQGLAFGVIHQEGVPSGWIGMGMASAYGVLLGLVRRASGGLMAPIGVHIVADAVILGILLTR
jgi:hypothetical protein